MGRTITWAVVAAAVFAGWQAPAVCGLEVEGKLEDSARRVASADRAAVASDIARLRQAGPAGLDALFKVHAAAIDRCWHPV